jgi:hypothetical protein
MLLGGASKGLLKLNSELEIVLVEVRGQGVAIAKVANGTEVVPPVVRVAG